MSEVTQNLPPTNEGYGTKEYWEQRYTRPCPSFEAGSIAKGGRALKPVEGPSVSFDWFLTPSYLLPIIEQILADAGLGFGCRILMLGCGNSLLSQMYDAGYHAIVNTDYSRAVINHMKEQNIAREGMQWLEMDVLDLKFEDEFDVVIDKGTMDAMLTTKGDPWNPPEKDVAACMKEVSEGLRVMRKQPSSRFIYFTFGQPHFRKRYFQGRPGWSLTHREVGPPEGFAYFLYMLSYTG